MPEETAKLLTQTKTRTKVLLGVALAVIISGIIVAAGVSTSSKSVCKGGAKDGKRCRRDKDCPAVSTGASAGKCVKTIPAPILPDLVLTSISLDQGPNGAFWRAEVTNQSTTTAAGTGGSNFIVRIVGVNADGSLTQPWDVPQPPLLPNQVSAIACGDVGGCLAQVTTGAISVRAIADINNNVVESNENNNLGEEIIPASP